MKIPVSKLKALLSNLSPHPYTAEDEEREDGRRELAKSTKVGGREVQATDPSLKAPPSFKL